MSGEFGLVNPSQGMWKRRMKPDLVAVVVTVVQDIAQSVRSIPDNDKVNRAWIEERRNLFNQIASPTVRDDDAVVI
jgi:hypothetical protein